MENAKLCITGNKIDVVINDIKRKYGNYNYELTETIWVCYKENYSLRNNSNLLNSIILQKTNETQIEVKIISGGGAGGIFQFAFGVEKCRVEEIVKGIKEIGEKYNQKVKVL